MSITATTRGEHEEEWRIIYIYIYINQGNMLILGGKILYNSQNEILREIERGDERVMHGRSIENYGILRMLREFLTQYEKLETVIEKIDIFLLVFLRLRYIYIRASYTNKGDESRDL
ncbi:hypothetical protein ACJX0J_013410, partial [Zea mays]